MAKPYNGYRSWNDWNVALWLANDQLFHEMCVENVAYVNRLTAIPFASSNKSAYENRLKEATNLLKLDLPSKTKDGANFNKRSISNYLRNNFDISDEPLIDYTYQT